MRILYYTWFENSAEDMEETLLRLGYEVVKCNIPFQDYEEDMEFSRQLAVVMQTYACNCIFSFNFFPMLARAAEKYQIKYISWVYDCPHWTLRSPAAACAYNYIFVFDRIQYLKLKQYKLPHLYHFPLAANTRKHCEILGTPQPGNAGTHKNEVSFVGSLYENNKYDLIQYLPEYLKGYLTGTMQAQRLIYGYNFVEELLTEDLIAQIGDVISMNLPKPYSASKSELYAAMLNEKITSMERISCLNILAPKYKLSLYTASNPSLAPKAAYGGTVDYRNEMPNVFRQSKINLNITLRSIQSGIPLRALDIMGAGGFLLSNYQPELAEQFEDGRELALYSSAEELLDKVQYYLTHEEERCEIAYHGFLKVQELFSYETRVKQMLELAEVE